MVGRKLVSGGERGKREVQELGQAEHSVRVQFGSPSVTQSSFPGGHFPKSSPTLGSQNSCTQLFPRRGSGSRHLPVRGNKVRVSTSTSKGDLPSVLYPE